MIEVLLYAFGIIGFLLTISNVLYLVRVFPKLKQTQKMAKVAYSMMGEKSGEVRSEHARQKHVQAIHQKAIHNIIKKIPLGPEIKKWTGLTEAEMFDYATDPVLGPKLIALFKIGKTVLDSSAEKIEAVAEGASKFIEGIGTQKKQEEEYPLLGKGVRKSRR